MTSTAIDFPSIDLPTNPNGSIAWGDFLRSLAVGQTFRLPRSRRVSLLGACHSAGARIVTRCKGNDCDCIVVSLARGVSAKWPKKTLPMSRDAAGWDAFFATLSAGDEFVIPLEDRAVFYSAGRGRRAEFTSWIHPENPDLLVIHIRDTSGIARRRILRDLKTLPAETLAKIHAFAIQAGLLAPA